MTDQINTGGPAFPCASEWGVGEAPFVQKGMDLRDYFAGQALAGVLASDSLYNEDEFRKLPGACYSLADAMIKAREEPYNP